jgi:hypothetical protein
MAGKRETIDTRTDKRYVRRDDKGQFKESDNVGRSLRQDARQHTKTEAKSGQGDKGDRSYRSSKAASALGQKPATKAASVTLRQANKAVRNYISTPKK